MPLGVPRIARERRTVAVDDIDFVISAYREDGQWQVESLPTHYADSLDGLVSTLRRLPADAGAIAFVSVDEDFFVAVRVAGPDVRVFLSDVTAATDWPIAREVLERLDLPLPDDDDPAQPAGDTTILADLGVEPMELAAVCDDIDSYPDEMVVALAEDIGIGPLVERALDTQA